MSPATIHADNRRVTARVVLFMVVAIIMTLVLFSGGPNGAISFAQQTSPVTSIEWVNPDDGQSTEISAKPDGSGAPTEDTYHLVAWVQNAPPGATVNFSYRVGTATPFPIGTATLIGSDTYEFNWAGTAMPPDGNYNLVATLLNGSTLAGTDTEAVVVNNAADDPPAGLDPRTGQAETVEIIEPDNADPLTFTDTAVGGTGMTATLQVKSSAGVSTLTPYYTTSVVGTEPAWTACKNGGQARADTITCELVGGTSGIQVTGVAVVANDAPANPAPLPDVESGDAHRVVGAGSSPSPSPSTTSPSPSTTSPSPSPSTTSPSPSTTSPSPSPSTSTPPPPIAYSSQTTIKYNGTAFIGKVKSLHRRCRAGRSVSLFKQTPGSDKKVGSDRTNKRGIYKIREPKANGTYYTFAKAKGFTDNAGRNVTCEGDRSRKKNV